MARPRRTLLASLALFLSLGGVAAGQSVDEARGVVARVRGELAAAEAPVEPGRRRAWVAELEDLRLGLEAARTRRERPTGFEGLWEGPDVRLWIARLPTGRYAARLVPKGGRPSVVDDPGLTRAGRGVVADLSGGVPPEASPFWVRRKPDGTAVRVRRPDLARTLRRARTRPRTRRSRRSGPSSARWRRSLRRSPTRRRRSRTTPRTPSRPASRPGPATPGTGSTAGSSS